MLLLTPMGGSTKKTGTRGSGPLTFIFRGRFLKGFFWGETGYGNAHSGAQAMKIIIFYQLFKGILQRVHVTKNKKNNLLRFMTREAIFFEKGPFVGASIGVVISDSAFFGRFGRRVGYMIFDLGARQTSRRYEGERRLPPQKKHGTLAGAGNGFFFAPGFGESVGPSPGDGSPFRGKGGGESILQTKAAANPGGPQLSGRGGGGGAGGGEGRQKFNRAEFHGADYPPARGTTTENNFEKEGGA